MKRLGRVPVRFPSKEDVRVIQKGFCNWWENIQAGSKASHNRILGKDVTDGLEEYLQEKKES